MNKNRIISICLLLLANVLAGAASGQHTGTSIRKTGQSVILENSRARAVFTKTDGAVSQEFFSFTDGSWLPVAAAFHSPQPFPAVGNRLFDESVSPDRILANDHVTEIATETGAGGQVAVVLTGMKGNVPVRQVVTLGPDDRHFHFTVSAEIADQPARIEYLLSAFVYRHDTVPEFVHTPTLKYNELRWDTPERQQTLGDRSFHSPAVILQQERLLAALVPDLQMINDHRIVSPDARRNILIPRGQFSVPILWDKYTMPTALDLNVRTGLTRQPVFSFGLIDNIIQHHIRYLHPDDGSMTRTLQSGSLQYGFDLFVQADAAEYSGYQSIDKFIWERYGHPLFTGKRHLAMPFADYVTTVRDVSFAPMGVQPGVEGYKNEGSWLGFTLNGQPVGGFRSAVPGWLDALWNLMFWNNARDAAGLWFWGQRLNDSTLIDKARRIINLNLAAPQNAYGCFPLIYRASTKTWQNGSTDVLNGQTSLFASGPLCGTYDVVSMSLTCARLLEYYRTCEADPRIPAYVRKYGDWLAGAVDADGVVPSYVGLDMRVSDVMKASANPGASLWMLAELHSATGDGKYLEAAEKIGAYLVREIIPRQKWVDLEQYFSCGAKPLTFTGDQEQGQLARGNLSISWAASGFAALYRETGKAGWLQAGEKCIDYLTFFQCSWDPHYIYTAYPFGGFTADNADHATYLDARQAEFAEPLIWYGKALGRQDLLERGIAAARSSVVLINHPLHKSNGIYEYTNIYPFGLGPENIDHEGHPQSAMRTAPGWGECSGVFTGLSNAYRELGGAYINTGKNIFAGVDGVTVDGYSLEGKTLTVSMNSMLDILQVPWDKPYSISLKVDGLEPDGLYSVILNGERTDSLTGRKLAGLDLKIFPGGDIFVDRKSLFGEEDLGLQVFPNPFSERVNIQVQEGFTRMRLFSMTGKLLEQEEFPITRRKSGMLFLPPGVYCLEVSDGTRSQITKVVRIR